MSLTRCRRVVIRLSLVLAGLCLTTWPARAALPKVPEGFEVRTVATVPAVNYPCQLATAPDGALFVAEDPMDQVGPYEADNGRILLFRDNQPPVVFAEGFRAIFGMAWHEGSLYVMNMPRLTVVRDTDGDGKADQCRELFTDLGPRPRPGALNDHIVSGLQFGMDGWLYIAVGDKGVPGATGPDGRKVQLKGGGILRCRPDGTELEVYSSGTRNHLEPNLDERDDLFTYDNTDDGDGWWTRVTHHVYSGYYGYPYDYHTRTDRMLNRMAEYGGGSPCGGIVYKEDVWPEPYRGRAFWAEWGKGKVQAFAFRPNGASFEVADVLDFAQPADVPNFKPIDLALSYDGRTLYVADWGMGGWGNKTEKVGRVFAISFTGEVKTRPRGSDDDPVAAQIQQLDHPSLNERMRAQRALIRKGRAVIAEVTTALASPKTPPLAARHLIWTLDGIAGATPEATMPLLDMLKSPVPDLRAQAARALGQRKVPIAVDPLLPLLRDQEPSVQLQAVIALGRIGDAEAIPALLPVLASQDPTLAFTSRQALRQIHDWKAAAQALKSEQTAVRKGVLAAMEQIYDLGAVQALAAVAADPAQNSAERAQALADLAEVHRKAQPWDGNWWGTRPSQGRPPAKVVDWDGTSIVLLALRDRLVDPEPVVRRAAVASVVMTGDRDSLPRLRAQLLAETAVVVRVEIARTLGQLKDGGAIPALVNILRQPEMALEVRESALGALESIGGQAASQALLDLLRGKDLPTEFQPRVIAALARFKAREARPLFLEKLSHDAAAVRVAAAEGLGQLGPNDEAVHRLIAAIPDRDVLVQRAAITALGTLHAQEAVPALLAAAEQVATRFESRMALAQIPDIRALQIYLQSLAEKNPGLRQQTASALQAIQQPAVRVLDQLAARRELPPSIVPELARIFTRPQPIQHWQVLGPFRARQRAPFALDQPIDPKAHYKGQGDREIAWQPAEASGPGSTVNLGEIFNTEGDQSAYGFAEIDSPTDRSAQLVVGSDDSLMIWLNGKRVFRFEGERGFTPEEERAEIRLKQGNNRLVVRCGNRGGFWMYAVAVTEPADYAFLKLPTSDEGRFNPEAFRQFALEGKGQADRGQALFHDPKGIGCIKCHAVSGQGGNVGPELSSIGAKYSRDDLIQSVLYPSARISSGYEAITIATTDGRILTGLLKSDTPEAIELADANAQRLSIPKAQVEERKPSELSIMPNGLAEGLSSQDFADLIAYLESLKDKPAVAAPGR